MGSATSNLVDAGFRSSDNPTTNVSKSCVENSHRIRTRLLVDLVSPLSNVDWKLFASAMVSKLDLPAQAVMAWYRDRDQSVFTETGSVTGIGKKTTTTGWDCLPNDFQADTFEGADFLYRFNLKAVLSGSKKFMEGVVLGQARGGVSEGGFPAINYYIKNNVWRCNGYDLHSKSWRSFLPVSQGLPPPETELFKEYSVSGHGGLMCAEVSKSPTKGELVVLNPLTGVSQALPPLLHPRNPVLVHILVASAKKSYKVIVAGSSSAGDEHLSKKVKVFDSSTSKWKEVCDLPDPAFGLNEHQTGVCLNGILFFISFLENDERRAVVALDVENGTWLQDLTVRIPWSSYSNTFQLVVSDGKLFLFSEQETDQSVEHYCIDELEFQNPKAGVLTSRWRTFVKGKKSDGLRKEKLGIFSPLTRKKLNILLASFGIASMPIGASADDHSIQDFLSSMWASNAWESPAFAQAVAGTILTGLVMLGVARFAWGIFRRRQVPGVRFDVIEGLENSATPTKGNDLFAISEKFPA